jgi:uncharacterized protein (TIGR02594 family)
VKLKTPPWLIKALKEKRVMEVPGEKANPRIVEYHAASTLKATSDEVPWCSDFVCWCLEEVGVPSTRSAAARSYLNYGHSISEPRPGCIVILSRGGNPSQAHVGFWLSEDGEHVFVFGGNQSDMVCVDAFEKSRVLDYRMPDKKYWNGDDGN